MRKRLYRGKEMDAHVGALKGGCAPSSGRCWWRHQGFGSAAQTLFMWSSWPKERRVDSLARDVRCSFQLEAW